MREEPKVSILIPVYGVEKFIGRCAESLFKQTYRNIEYIFVNDCTKDESIYVLRETLSRFPERETQVRIVAHNQNRGLAAARNTAVAEATGEFIMHVDSDDYVDEHIVEKAMCKQQENDADIVVIDFLQAHPAFTVSRLYLSFAQPKDYCIDVLARKSTNSIWAKLIRRSLYTDNGIACKEGCNQGEDFQVVPILLYNAKRIVNLHEALYYYDCSNGGSYSNNFSISKHEQNWESMDIVRDYFKDKGEEYVEAVNCGRIRQLVDDLIISAKISGEAANYYYSYAVKELGHTGKKYRIAVSKQKRSILLFVRYYWLMRSYILVLRGVRYFFLKYLYCGKRDL